MRRFFIPPEQFGDEESVITGPDAHHLGHVLRLKPQDVIVVFDGTGREWRAQVVSIARRHVKVAMLEPLKASAESALSLAVAQGFLKDKKMDVLVRQLTELGVSRWMPFYSRRSVPAPDRRRLEGRCQRWRKISLEALKQCGRSRSMAIGPVEPFDQVLEQTRDYDLKLIFWEEAKTALLDKQALEVHPASVVLILGPEGGFEADEIERAEAAGFTTVGLGPRILKAETAALTAAATAQFVFGDMGPAKKGR